MADIEALKGKLSSLTSVKKSQAVGESSPKPTTPHTDYFETLYIDGRWYGRRNHKCYLVIMCFWAMSESHFKYEKPSIDSTLDKNDVIIETTEEGYYIPCSNWTPFRKGWSFKGRIVNHALLVDVHNIDDHKPPKYD